jgi:hypothetical protein
LQKFEEIAARHGDRRAMAYALRAAWHLRQRQAELAVLARSSLIPPGKSESPFKDGVLLPVPG